PGTSFQHLSILEGRGPQSSSFAARTRGSGQITFSSGLPAYNWAKSSTTPQRARTYPSLSSRAHPL
ncbi:hypothetical protein A2U01_0082890, partial [Trifolium medium]|nr:hypothetical protein [Trifolium medium]